MIISKKLKEVNFEYDVEAQQLSISTKDGTVKMNKTYMFSTAIFIAQLQRRQFMHKSVIAKLNKIEK